MTIVAINEFTLPLTNPVLKFLIILIIILFSPLLLNKIRIPHLLGLIIAGAVIGPHGINLLERDSGIILSGTAGLLYIMFLAGLEIDLADFKKNSSKSIIFGLLTFSIPMITGTIVSLYVLHYSVLTSVLLASMFASHTLIAYPIIRKLGVTKNRAVNITVGGTMITDTLALLVLAVIVRMTAGEVTANFWLQMTISIIVFGSIVLFVFPLIGRWFLKRFDDNASQYIFILAMVFLGAVLAELAGIESIIGAFLTGLAFNRLIPRISPLMTRVDFVGNAIFIPFFLISVGMLIDYRIFLSGPETIKVAVWMILVATVAKFLAALITQKTFRFSTDERRLIFGLSNAQAAATLAAVMVGYNIVIGETESGEPIRLLGENILNGTILMILFTCTHATFSAQKGAKNIAVTETSSNETGDFELSERILIPVSNPDTVDELINLSILIKNSKTSKGLYALSVVSNYINNPDADSQAKKILRKAAQTAANTDHDLQELLRYDLNVVNAISSVVKEHKITDLIIGLHHKSNISESFLGSLTEGILKKCNTTVFIYKALEPLSSVKKHRVIVPPKAEHETGFPLWIIKLWNLAKNTGASIVFYSSGDTLQFLKKINANQNFRNGYNEFNNWDNFSVLFKEMEKNDNLIIVLSRREKPSFQALMKDIPVYISNHFKTNSFILLYPVQEGKTLPSALDLRNPAISYSAEKLEEITKNVLRLFKH